MRLWFFLLLLAPHSGFASKCRTCRGQKCKNNSQDLLESCTIFSSTVPFVTIAHGDKELLDYGCLELEYLSKGGSNEIIQKCVMAENLDTICAKIAEKTSYLICNVQTPIMVDQDLPSTKNPDVKSETPDEGTITNTNQQQVSRIINFVTEEVPNASSDSLTKSKLEPISDAWHSTTDESNTYDIWGDKNSSVPLKTTSDYLASQKTTGDSLDSKSKDSSYGTNTNQFDGGIVTSTISNQFPPEPISDSSNSDLLVTTDHLETLRPTTRLDKSSETTVKVYVTEETTIYDVGDQEKTDSDGEIRLDDSIVVRSTSEDLGPQQTTTDEGLGDATKSSTIVSSSQNSSSETIAVASNLYPHEEATTEPDVVVSDTGPTATEFLAIEKHSEASTLANGNHYQDKGPSWQDSSTLFGEITIGSFDYSTVVSLNSNSLDDLGDDRSENASKGEKATNPIEESKQWQDSTTKVEATTSMDWEDSSTTGSFDDSTLNSLNSTIPGIEGNSEDDLGDIPAKNASKGKKARNPDSLSSPEESNHWQDSSTAVEVTTSRDSFDGSTQKSQHSNIPGTEDDLGDIPLENASNIDVMSNSHSTSPIGESNHSPNSSIVVVATTRKHWEDSFEDSTQESPNSDIPNAEGYTVDVLGDIFSESASNVESSNPHATSPIEESNHDLKDLFDDSTQKSSNSNMPSTEGHTVDHLGDIPLENTSNVEASNSESTSSIEESNHWQESSTKVEATTSEDWEYSFNDSTQKSPNSNLPSTDEGHLVNDLGDIPSENASTVEVSSSSHLTSPNEESSHWQESATVVEATTSKDWEDSFDDSSQESPNSNMPGTEGHSVNALGYIPSENASNVEVSNPHSTSPIGESNHWQESSTVVEATTSEDWEDSFDDSTQKSPNSEIPSTEGHSVDDLGDIPAKNASKVEVSNPHSTSPIEESNHWQESSTVFEATVTTSNDWEDSFDDSTQESSNSNMPGTEGHSVNDLRDIPSENASNVEVSNAQTSPIAKSYHWQDSSTMAEATTSKDWEVSFDDSTQKSQNSNIPGIEGHSVDDLGNASNVEVSNPHSTSPNGESNHWSDSTVGEETTSKYWEDSFDDSTQESPNSNRPSTEGHTVADLGDIPSENASNVELSNPHSTLPIEGSNQWQDSYTVVESTTSEDRQDSFDDSTQKTPNSNMPGTEDHSVDDFGDIPSENASNVELSNPRSTLPIEESNQWQDSSTVVEATTSKDRQDSFDDSTQKSPNSNIPGTEDHSVDDLGNASNVEVSNPHSTSPNGESNHWSDPTVGEETTSKDWEDSFDDFTKKSPNSNRPSTEGHTVADLGDIPSENASNVELSNPHSTLPIEGSNQWQDSSTVVEATTSEDRQDSFDDSTQKTPNSNMPGTEDHSVDDFGDIPSENASNVELSNPHSTLPIEESNQWQDSSTVVEATTSKDRQDSFDDSTQKSPNSNIPGTEDHSVDDLGNASNVEVSNPHSTSPNGESNHWSDPTVGEETTSKDWEDSFDDSTKKSPNSNRPSTEGHTVADLGDIPSENASNVELSNPHSTSPNEESNHWSDSTVGEGTTNKDWEDSFDDSTKKSPNSNRPSTEGHTVADLGDIPSENASNVELSNPHSTLPIEGSNQWQDSSTVVEATTSKDRQDSFDDSTQKSPNSNIPGTEDHSVDDLGNASNVEVSNPHSTSPNGESNHWSYPTVGEETTSKDWEDSFDDSTKKSPNSNRPSTEGHTVADLGDIPSENASNVELSNPHSTSPIDESHHWQDFSTTGLFEDSVQKSSNSDIPATEGYTVDDLGDIPAKNNASNVEVSYPHSTSPIEESNHWQESSTVVEATTSKDWEDSYDDSTQKSPNSDIPGTEGYTVDDLGDVPAKNASNVEVSNPHSPIEESNHWQDSSTVEATSSRDWENWFDDSTKKSPNSDNPGTESHLVDGLGDIPPEIASTEEEANNPYLTEESNHRQESSTLFETTPSKNWTDSVTTSPKFNISGNEDENSSDIPLDDAPNFNPNEEATISIEESSHWQEHSTVVEITTNKDWNYSVTSPKFNVSGTEGESVDDSSDIPLDDAPNEEEATNPIQESSHWQDSPTPVEATTRPNFNVSATTVDTPSDDDNSSEENATTTNEVSSGVDDSENIPADTDPVEATTANIDQVVFENPTPTIEESANNETTTVAYEDKSGSAASKSHLSSLFCIVAFVSVLYKEIN